jgi:cytidylate kinase
VVRRDADDSTVSQFLEAAEGVVVVDSSHLALDETVAAVLDVVAARTGVTAT